MNTITFTAKYGTYFVNYDVTNTVLLHYYQQQTCKLVIPIEKRFNDLFGDPAEYQKKNLTILHGKRLYIIDEYDTEEHTIDLTGTPVNKPLITFIIPSINRPTLLRTLESISKQTDPDWEAVCVFDKVDPSPIILAEIQSNPKFRYIVLMKKLGEGTNSGGNVRNMGINTVSTEWIGFVDDDDTISPLYVQRLKEELNRTQLDLVIFRGLFNFGRGRIMPLPEHTTFIQDYVGIHFCYKLKAYRAGMIFEPSNREDFTLLDKIRSKQYKMVMSPFITYYVNYNDIADDDREQLEQQTPRIYH